MQWPSRSVLRRDTVAALINAVVSVPDGLASAALAGVNPVFGLYTSVAAPTSGSLLASAQLMQISTTSAAALAAGQAVAAYPEPQRAEAMFLLTVLTGLGLVLFSLLRLGRLARFVSHAVMTGFLTGVAVVLVLDQLAPLLGANPTGANELTQFVDLLSRGREFDAPTIAMGVLALALAAGLARTRIATFSSLVALVVPSLLVAAFGWESVALVSDVSVIPRGVPLPSIPDLSLVSPALAGSAFAVAAVIAVQGAGVSQSVENPDGRRIDASRDMLAQGVANVAAGMLRGIPAGGSVGQTALNVSLGARSRWAGVLAGVWMLVIVLLVPTLVGEVPMAVLAALMILAGISALDVREAHSIWATGGTARWSIVVTFAATLVFSVPVAVGVGIVLSVVLTLASAASDVRVHEVVRLPDGRFAQAEPPAGLRSEAVVVLEVVGSLFFAGARTLEEALPSPRGSTRPAVVLRVRGRTSAGATLIEVLDEYADDLAEVGGRLYLSGVDERLAAQLRRARKLDVDGTVRLVPAREVLGDSTLEAIEQATAWLASAEPSDGAATRDA